MVSFGKELQTTLKDVVGGDDRTSRGRGLDASKFAIIQDLVDGDRIKEATKLARDLSKLSLECVDKSNDMMTAMERGIDALPDAIEPFVENKLAKAITKGHRDSDPKLPDVKGSVREMKDLVENIENVNLFTVVDRGNAAFDGLRKNGELSKDMFQSIQSFAVDVETVSGSLRDIKKEDFKNIKTIGKIRKAAKSAWRCLRLSGLIQAFAQQVGELIRWMISLFQIASKKLGAIWGALANAKSLLAACLEGVIGSMKLCDDSNEKSRLLYDTTKEVRDHLKNISKLGASPARAIKSLVDLADGDEIKLCIELGKDIDDLFGECIKQVLGTIDKVDRAISDMPDVLKHDVPELTPVDGGGDDDDEDAIEFEDYAYASRAVIDSDNTPRIRSRAATATNQRTTEVSDKVRALEDMTSGIESSSPLTVLKRSAEGLDGVEEAVGTCNELIVKSRGYAESCRSAIDSFNHGEWDLAVATQHILELFAIRDAGMAMKILAESVLELIRANLALLKAVRSKTKGLSRDGNDSGSGSTGEIVGSLVGALAEDVDLDDIKGGIKKLGAFFR